MGTVELRSRSALIGMGRTARRAMAALTALAALSVLGCTRQEVRCSDEAQCGDGNGRNIDAKTSAELKLAKVTAQIKDSVSGEQSRGGEDSEKSNNLRAVNIDLTVKNLGDHPAFISKATMTFDESGHLKPCYAIGGDLLSTANYTFTIPDDQPRKEGTLLHVTPFSISKELTHEIPPNKYEKFTLTVGPKTIPDGGSPWFGVLHITLFRDTGDGLKIGPLAVVNTGGNPAFYPEFDKNAWHIEKEHFPGCTKKNAEKISSIMAISDRTPSVEFSSLNKALQNYK